MGEGIQTSNGKAFEYACVLALCRELDNHQEIVMAMSPPMETAKRLYANMDDNMRQALDAAAFAAVRVIKQLEPQLCKSNGNEPLLLSLQADAAGIHGDVRDVLCVRKQNGWEIGISCKHNHHAVKHSRLSDTIDFGKEWLGIPCSVEYFDRVKPLFAELREIRDESNRQGNPALWSNIGNKTEKYYIPILQAFMDELRKISENSDENVPEKLIRYLLGRNDFYKVITDDRNRTTRVEVINIAGTLNQTSGALKPITKVPMLKMPSQFYHIGFKANSDNTIEVVCDEGWQISMRIHNASSKVEPSLKFDVNLISLPSTVYTQMEPWDRDLGREQMGRAGGFLRQFVEDINKY